MEEQKTSPGQSYELCYARWWIRQRIHLYFIAWPGTSLPVPTFLPPIIATGTTGKAFRFHRWITPRPKNCYKGQYLYSEFAYDMFVGNVGRWGILATASIPLNTDPRVSSGIWCNCCQAPQRGGCHPSRQDELWRIWNGVRVAQSGTIASLTLANSFYL